MPILGTIASSRLTSIPAVPGMTYISTVTVTGSPTSSVSISGFGGYDDLLILMSGRTDNNGNADNQLTVNNNTTANAYRAKLLFASSAVNGESAAGSNVYRAGYMPYYDMTSFFYGNNLFYFHDYASTNTYKTIRWQGVSPVNTSSSYMIMAEAIANWDNTAAITSIQMTCAGFGSSYSVGTQFFVYGITR